MTTRLASAAAALALLAIPTSPNAYDLGRPDAHAPIGVMGDHVHHQGELMLSFRTMRMSMRGNRDGTRRRTKEQVLRPVGDFMVTPTSMDMEMHMFGVMYAPLEDLTLMAMVPFVRLDMDHITATGVKFKTRSKGFGDVRLTGLYRLWENEVHSVHLNMGLSIPTGSISQKDDTPAGRVRLPYPMQLGSGTWDALPGLTYNAQVDDWSWGAQVLGTIRTGTNGHGYRLGHRYDVTSWLGHRFADWLSAAFRVHWMEWYDIRGADSALNPMMVPTADPDRRGGSRLDVGLGLNLYGRSGPVRGHRLALEATTPLYQFLDGPQLETDYALTLGWQYAF